MTKKPKPSVIPKLTRTLTGKANKPVPKPSAVHNKLPFARPTITAIHGALWLMLSWWWLVHPVGPYTCTSNGDDVVNPPESVLVGLLVVLPSSSFSLLLCSLSFVRILDPPWLQNGLR
ncbi:hypothetical protein ACA910_010291 [Epithemia clementina (nom. ined.)]